jgi:hypothetical protein
MTQTSERATTFSIGGSTILLALYGVITLANALGIGLG